MAVSAFLLAKATGWSLETILWELPITILNQAEHVFLWQDGAKLRRVGYASQKDRRDISKILGI
ncbi:hypothetical protein EBS57_08535 [bacterium]|nr:hypothetical protein [bacterium]